VRLYDVEAGWALRKDVQARMARWTVTDTAISPDQRFLLYASIVPVVHVVQVRARTARCRLCAWCPGDSRRGRGLRGCWGLRRCPRDSG
jgi:hypothetical protein